MTQCKKSNKKRTKNIKYHKVAFYKTIETKLINPFFFCRNVKYFAYTKGMISSSISFIKNELNKNKFKYRRNEKYNSQKN